MGAFANNLRTRLSEAVNAAANESLEMLKESVSTPYPSSPNAPPHERSGNLEAGLNVAVDGVNVEFSSSASYSDDLEFGTHKMQQRPFLRPHRMIMAQDFPQMIARCLTC